MVTSTNYQRRILVSLFRTFVLPPIFAAVMLHLLGKFNTLHGFLMVLSIPFHIIFRSFVYTVFYNRTARQLGAQPIPRVVGKLPGNIDVMFRLVKSLKTGYVMQEMADLFEECQSTIINTRVLWDDQIICVDEEILKFLFVTGFEQFERGYSWHERMDDLLGNGIFNTDGEKWKKNRTLARPFFAKDRISDMVIFEKSTNVSLDILQARANTQEPCDVQDLYARFTLDTAGEFLFGAQLDTLKQPIPSANNVKMGPRGSTRLDGKNEFDEFSSAFEEIQVALTRRGQIGPIWPLYEMLEDKTARGRKVIEQWLYPLVQKAVREKSQSQRLGIRSASSDVPYLNYMAENTDDVHQIHYELLNMLIAARDTTSSLLTFITYLVCVHPEVQSRLREEIVESLGRTGQPSYENMKNLKYLDAVVKETLRLFPSAAMLLRTSKETPLVLPGADGAGYYLPPHTQVVFSSLLVHKRSELWGETCHEFNPERWFDATLLAKIRSKPFMYFPFHGGPRACIGQNFAINEANYFLISLMQRFDKLELALDAQPEGSLPPPEWKSGKGRQAIEKLCPSIAFTLYIKVT